MGIPVDADLDRRRARAHRYALGVLVVAVAVRALFAAGSAAVVIAGAARFQTWVTGDDIRRSVLWHRLPLLTLAAVVVAVALSALFAARAVAFGVAWWTFKGLPLRDPAPDEMTQVRNVLHALGIGLGIEPPTLRVLDDDAPNALSARQRDRRIICVTTGLAALPRDEIEAVCAHELLHVSAPDARVVGAAFLTTIRARNTALTAIVAGLLMACGAAGALKYDLVLPTLFLVGAGLTAVAAVAYGALSKPLESLRRQSDEVADVGAVLLARNPMALAHVLDRLVTDERRVATTNDRCGHQWFEACEEVLTPAETEEGRAKRAEAIAAANDAIVAELKRRSALATATAAGIAR